MKNAHIDDSGPLCVLHLRSDFDAKMQADELCERVFQQAAKIVRHASFSSSSTFFMLKKEVYVLDTEAAFLQTDSIIALLSSKR